MGLVLPKLRSSRKALRPFRKQAEFVEQRFTSITGIRYRHQRTSLSVPDSFALVGEGASLAPVNGRRPAAGAGRWRGRGVPWSAGAAGHHGRGWDTGYPASPRRIGGSCRASPMPIAAPRNHDPAGAIPGHYRTGMNAFTGRLNKNMAKVAG